MATITLKGSPINTCENLPAVGSSAHDFTVTKTDLSEISLKNYPGKKIILNVFPSLDTSTCATAMLKFNEIAAKHKDILILCVSADLPFAQKRFCAAEHLDNVQPVSVFRHPQFGNDYGLGIIDGPLAGLLARAVILIDEHKKIVYTELVPEITNEPDYDSVVKILGPA